MSKHDEVTLTEEQLKVAERMLREQKAAAKKKVIVAYAIVQQWNETKIIRVEFHGTKKTASAFVREPKQDKAGLFVWEVDVHVDDIDQFMPTVRPVRPDKSQPITYARDARPKMRGRNILFSTLDLAREAVAISRRDECARIEKRKLDAFDSYQSYTAEHADSVATLEADLAAIAKMEPSN